MPSKALHFARPLKPPTRGAGTAREVDLALDQSILVVEYAVGASVEHRPSAAVPRLPCRRQVAAVERPRLRPAEEARTEPLIARIQGDIDAVEREWRSLGRRC